MLGQKEVRKSGVMGILVRAGSSRWGLALSAALAGMVLPVQARAQCFLNGNPTTECVRLEWRPAQQTVFVGDTVDIGLYAVSVDASDQPIPSLGFLGADVVVDWDPGMLELLGNRDDCTAGCTTGCESDPLNPCYVCPADPVAGTPVSYNWITSGFPNDQDLDGLNDPFTGLPFNDGDAFYQAIQQLFCNGIPAAQVEATADGLLVTTLQFQAIGPGTAQVTILPSAECKTRQMVCLRGDPINLGNPCTVDSDCGERVCLGGSNNGVPCTSDIECPSGECAVLCTACLGNDCCTADDNCSSCSFAESRVVSTGGGGAGGAVQGPIGPPALVTISSCQPADVQAIGPRYLGITPAPGPDPVALRVTGVNPQVGCVSGYVQVNGVVAASPLFMTPAAWGRAEARGEGLVSGMTYSVEVDCDPANPGTTLSDPVTATLWKRGDVDNNNDTNIIDVVKILDGFRGSFNSMISCTSDADCTGVPPNFTCNVSFGLCYDATRENVDIIGASGCAPDRDISILDVAEALDAFRGLADLCLSICIP